MPPLATLNLLPHWNARKELHSMRPDFSELVYSNNHYQSLSGLCEKNSIQYIHKNGKTKYNINSDNPAKVTKT